MFERERESNLTSPFLSSDYLATVVPEGPVVAVAVSFPSTDPSSIVSELKL
jgi:hypothetical protein